jgi:hypothetical protein
MARQLFGYDGGEPGTQPVAAASLSASGAAAGCFALFRTGNGLLAGRRFPQLPVPSS